MIHFIDTLPPSSGLAEESGYRRQWTIEYSDNSVAASGEITDHGVAALQVGMLV